VGPAHCVLQEYLSTRPDPDVFGRPRSIKKKICLNYPGSQKVKALPAAPSPDTQNKSFLEYCLVHSRTHAKRELLGYEILPKLERSAYELYSISERTGSKKIYPTIHRNITSPINLIPPIPLTFGPIRL